MQQFLSVMLAPFVECLLVVGLHTYLGIHVLKRRVVFVDLSLAQIAALGTTIGILFGIHDTESPASFVMSVGFTLVGAAIFTMTRTQRERVPQEAIIGLVYAITAAVAVLIVQKTRGMEHLIDIMHGRLLWVSWGEVAEAAILYTILGALHFLFRRRFLLISEDPKAAFAQRIHVGIWDFFFYFTFGVTISVSVKVAGVLLVFVFLIAPAILALLVSHDLKVQLLVGWTAGTLVTVVGLSLSWVLDLPSDPLVIACYGVVLLVAAVIAYVVRSQARWRALARVGMAVAATGAVAALVFGGGRFLAASPLAGHEEDLMLDADAVFAAEPAPVPVDDAPAPAHPDDPVACFLAAATPFDRLEMAESLLSTDPDLGVDLLVTMLHCSLTPPLCRSTAVEILEERAGRTFGYDPDRLPAENHLALRDIRRWAAKRKSR
ncbi:MAG: metal ABC transporter permease [Deltaproteobacteria bacterium]|nr:metal ABC transporter permease [Deltaproteobacteria bacterium]